MRSDANTPSETREGVAVIGLGLMGQALAGAFLNAGHPTTVWNRTADKADALVDRGAVRAGTVAEAVAAAEVVVVCLSTYEVALELLEPLTGTLAGRTLVNLTSGSPEQARQTADWAAGHGIPYLDGAVMSIPIGVGQPEAVLLYSGPRALFDAHRATLAALGGGTTHLGEDFGLASLYDVALLGLMWSTMSGYVHAVALLGAEGVDARTFTPVGNRWLSTITGYLTEYAKQVDAGAYPADATLDIQVTTMEHVLHASRERGVNVELPTLIKTLAERAIAAGHGGSSFASLVEVMRKPA
ncbi:NAD(P)-dependent oxidoreductase [Allostreptomyces psammosilenae]|uniref:3-hydroxyisobutyrate dehydrogenase-like beta-hydroxyacid dehydrogenase n=1 Tax=Allostreptomyces psammosilenae TaxID=1892865 RepID=A0A853AAY9_9ACTN|nr:NAD(P)-binding domain-containing protein [Allostreptomyces psammosilenae]NYI07532.1 3-hydroxyisobutyrate dehydrogenase-like beta-hydroxyacid dehydrogenase [Allostreptomyces psammosilenae]